MLIKKIWQRASQLVLVPLAESSSLIHQLIAGRLIESLPLAMLMEDYKMLLSPVEVVNPANVKNFISGSSRTSLEWEVYRKSNDES